MRRPAPTSAPQAPLIDAYDAIERELLARLSGKAELVAVLTYYTSTISTSTRASDDDVAAIKALLAIRPGSRT